ncbi:MAG: ATP-binding protein, partial [Selenomonadaceae bacterium]|nr:ATP-binding protein [Selenomonadaceae bacterium]
DPAALRRILLAVLQKYTKHMTDGHLIRIDGPHVILTEFHLMLLCHQLEFLHDIRHKLRKFQELLMKHLPFLIGLRKEKELLEFSELVADVMKKFKLVAKEHEVELRQNDVGTIYADQVTIRHMLRIFLENSQKYTPKGGRIYAESRREGNVFHLVLGDTGIGIASENQEKVFERFYRVDSSRTKAEGGVSGTGLGLSIARWIAEQHDIKISLKSELGKGTEIHLQISLAGVEPVQSESPEVTQEGSDGQGFWGGL